MSTKQDQSSDLSPEQDALPIAEVPDVVQRLNLVLKKVGGGTKAAEIAGFSRNSIYEWSKGNTRIPLDAAVSLTRAAGVTLDWLATGRDERPANATPRQRPTSELVTNVYGISPGQVTAPDGYVVIRHLAVEASAGPGLVASGIGERLDILAFRESWLRSLGVSPANAEFLQGRGDSMSPTIEDGDMMLLDRGYGSVVNGKIYVLVVNSLVIVKRLHVLAVGGLMLISDNERYPTETIPASEVNDLSVQGRVAWYGRAM